MAHNCPLSEAKLNCSTLCLELKSQKHHFLGPYTDYYQGQGK